MVFLDKEYIAELPIEIVKPVVQDLYKNFVPLSRNARAKYPGASVMADYYEVDHKVITQILSGKKKSISIDICDRITQKSDYDLNTLFEETKQWAKENPKYNWPDNYI